MARTSVSSAGVRGAAAAQGSTARAVRTAAGVSTDRTEQSGAHRPARVAQRRGGAAADPAAAVPAALGGVPGRWQGALSRRTVHGLRHAAGLRPGARGDAARTAT